MQNTYHTVMRSAFYINEVRVFTSLSFQSSQPFRNNRVAFSFEIQPDV